MKISILDSKNKGKIKNVVDVTDIAHVSGYAQEYNWCPSIFKTDTRSVANFESVDILALDVDEGCTIDEAKKYFSGYEFALLPTKSHQIDKHGVICDRFRVLIPLEATISDIETYSATWNKAMSLWPFIDKACKDTARFYYKSGDPIYMQDGNKFQLAYAAIKPAAIAAPIVANEGTKGLLSRKTLDFLVHGAPAGSRHNALVAAVGDMRDQGYDLDEITQRITTMTLTGDWTQIDLSSKDSKTIADVFKREGKYALRLGIQTGAAPAATLTETPLDLINETLDYLADKDKVKGDATGIEGLDKILGGGFRTGELTVLMAQAKTGKNSLYHYMIYQMMQRDIKVAYASRELSPAAEVIPNLISIATGNNAWKAEITDGFREFVKSMASNWPLRFAAGYGYFPPEQLVAWMRAMKESGYNHFLIDHLHYMLKGEDYESTAELIKIIKTQTKELDVHVNLIVQPRSLREGEKLSLATLRGGAAIGQALDNLLIFERVRGENNVSKLTLEVARHKLAKPGSLYLSYDSESTIFTEVDKVMVQEEPDPRMQYGSRQQRPYPRIDN